MPSSDELHDHADDAVEQIVGWFCICDRGLVAMELLRSGGCIRTWVFLRWVCFIFDQDIFLTTTFFYANGHFVMFYTCILRDNITALLTLPHCLSYKSELQQCITSSFFACLCYMLRRSALRNGMHCILLPHRIASCFCRYLLQSLARDG